MKLAAQIRQLQKLGQECSKRDQWAPIIVFVDELDSKQFSNLKAQLRRRPRCVCTLVYVQRRVWPESMLEERRTSREPTDIMFSRTVGNEAALFKHKFEIAARLLSRPSSVTFATGDVLLAMFPLQIFGRLVDPNTLAKLARRFLYDPDIDPGHRDLLVIAALVQEFGYPYCLPNFAVEVGSLPEQLHMVLIQDSHTLKDAPNTVEVRPALRLLLLLFCYLLGYSQLA